MAETLLITDLQLTKGSPLGGNIDIDKYRSVIAETQLFVIEPALGTKLYEKIKTDYAASNLTGVYLKIVEDYVRPIIIKHVAAEYIRIGGFAVVNAGVVRYTPENTTPASQEEISRLVSNQLSKVDVYLDRLERYLCSEQANIPEYTSAQDNTYDQKPDKDLRTYSGWRLGYKTQGMMSAEREIFKDIWIDEGRR